MSIAELGKESVDGGPASSKRQWSEWDKSEEGFGSHRRIGVELDAIPLCGACGIETEGDSPDQVLERGLVTVSAYDGGLSRDRMAMLSDERSTALSFAPKHAARIPRRLRGASGIERDLKRFINGSSRASTDSLVSRTKP